MYFPRAKKTNQNELWVYCRHNIGNRCNFIGIFLTTVVP